MICLPGIYTAAASRTGKTGQRGQSHTRVPALASLDGTDTCATAEVQSDNIEIVGIPVKKIRNRACDEGIADTVEAILAEAVALCNLAVNGICVDVGWDSGMELRVKTGNVDCAREKPDACIDNAESDAIMKGG